MSKENQKSIPKMDGPRNHLRLILNILKDWEDGEWLLFLKKLVEIIVEILNKMPQDPTPAERKACEACLANLLSISKELHYELGESKPGAHA